VVGIKESLGTLASDVDSYLETADVVFSETPTLAAPAGTRFVLPLNNEELTNHLNI